MCACVEMEGRICVCEGMVRVITIKSGNDAGLVGLERCFYIN